MKSGDFSISREDEYYRKQFADVSDPAFVQRTFFSHAALVAKQPVNGHRSICWFTIKDGFTYWENTDRIRILCDACYEALTKMRANRPI
jgi:hypothetical protein